MSPRSVTEAVTVRVTGCYPRRHACCVHAGLPCHGSPLVVSVGRRERRALAKQRAAYFGRKKTLALERGKLVQPAAGGVRKSVRSRDYGISR